MKQTHENAASSSQVQAKEEQEQAFQNTEVQVESLDCQYTRASRKQRFGVLPLF